MIASGTPTSDNDDKDNHNNDDKDNHNNDDKDNHNNDSTSTQYSKMINNKNNNKK